MNRKLFTKYEGYRYGGWGLSLPPWGHSHLHISYDKEELSFERSNAVVISLVRKPKT